MRCRVPEGTVLEFDDGALLYVGTYLEALDCYACGLSNGPGGPMSATEIEQMNEATTGARRRVLRARWAEEFAR